MTLLKDADISLVSCGMLDKSAADPLQQIENALNNADKTDQNGQA